MSLSIYKELPVEQADRQARPIEVGIVGLGLIGGSLARALASRAGARVTGLDRDADVIDRALAEGVLKAGGVLNSANDTLSDQPNNPDDSWHLLAPCEIVFVCTPVDDVIQMALQAARVCSGLITDAASVKQPIMSGLVLDRFIGGHPMAGSERRGYAHASESLFENALYILCVRPGSQLPLDRMEQLEQLIRQIGATPLRMSAEAHDQAVAAVSHLPHVAASALSLLAARLDQGDLARLAAGGFRDITRIASANPRLWTDICQHSAPYLVPILDQFLELIQSFRNDLYTKDTAGLEKFFFQAGFYRNTLPVDGRGALISQSPLTVFIHDRPGELGRITTLLGEQGINISNIRIRESRAYEGGVLQLLIASSDQAAKAAWILEEAGYVCD